MDAAFWQGVWERNSLGFHQDEVHPFLLSHFEAILKPTDRHVFVPLCGKSLDMTWLAQHLSVTGSELSKIACRDFFNECELAVAPQAFQSHFDVTFQRYQHKNIDLLQGDFFKLDKTDMLPVDIIYDRAALIALPEKMQTSYVQHLISFMQPHTRLFMVALEFPADEMSGPPFPVAESHLRGLLDEIHLTGGGDQKIQVNKLASRELVDKRFAQRVFNVSSLVETLYLITLEP